ncbi:pyridoxamine 5'-phosphate oxidase family protein [Actinoplanes sp. KI2]|uniref:pyridoxamine 5'-phosphate oxidase family protein n=1 Tax=Actinoplanes sp. KI2 TaxID=2983315 RepID=UPI0021D5837A|nr:pyridoxamine 5'-phosphate oxidase family protein [Actinoplanes sp. KI2]MCU7723513.1 pyridoxamine 5'-phosphate oxidase family protein [Actinoplanes sp. KI2]
MPDQPRPRIRRKSDVLARLAAPVADCWVATAGGDEPYLVPLTAAWHDGRIILATSRRSPTARNITAHGRARVGLGPTRDVILIDATLDETIPVADSGTVGEAYARQNDWDPREAGEGFVFLALRPRRIQAWREENELPDRLLMQDGAWLV